MSIAKPSHIHHCPTGHGHMWEHKVYGCPAESTLLCPEHAVALAERLAKLKR